MSFKESTHIKAVVTGPRDGKTSFCYRCKYGNMPAEFKPGILDEDCSVDVEIDKKMYCVNLIDSWGQSKYERLRALSYPNSDVIIMMFSITQPQTLEFVKDDWIPEVQRHCPKVPVLLVGNRIDQRPGSDMQYKSEKSNFLTVSPRMGDAMARQVNAIKYLECSCKTGRGVRTVVYEAVWATLGTDLSELSNSGNVQKCCELV